MQKVKHSLFIIHVYKNWNEKITSSCRQKKACTKALASQITKLTWFLKIPTNITKLKNQILNWHIFHNVPKPPLLAHIISENLDILRSITHPATRIIMIKNKVMRVKHYCIA